MASAEEPTMEELRAELAGLRNLVSMPEFQQVLITLRERQTAGAHETEQVAQAPPVEGLEGTQGNPVHATAGTQGNPVPLVIRVPERPEIASREEPQGREPDAHRESERPGHVAQEEPQKKD